VGPARGSLVVMLCDCAPQAASGRVFLHAGDLGEDSEGELVIERHLGPLLKEPAKSSGGPSLQEASANIDLRVNALEEKIVKADEEVRQHVAKGASNPTARQRALQAMKRKKMYEQQRDQLLGTQFNVENLAFQQEQAFINGTSATEAERTLQLGLGEDGRLQHAEPHPVLGLQKEAEEAVARDDLARLVTPSWDRICKGSEERQPLNAERSRAELDQSMMSARRGGA